MCKNNRREQLQAEAERDEALQALDKALEAFVELEAKYQYVLKLWYETLQDANGLAERFEALRETHQQHLDRSGRLHDN